MMAVINSGGISAREPRETGDVAPRQGSIYSLPDGSFSIVGHTEAGSREGKEEWGAIREYREYRGESGLYPCFSNSGAY